MREGADPLKLREEGVHLAQTVDPEWAPRIRKLDEARMAKWDDLPLTEQMDMYRTKLDVEIDGQKRLLARLEELLEDAGDDPMLRASLLDQIEDVTENAKNLRKLRDQAKDIPFSDRLLIGIGLKKKPEFLDQPPRLFAKKPPKKKKAAAPAKTNKKLTQKELETEARQMYNEAVSEGYAGIFDRAEFIQRYKSGQLYDPEVHAWRNRYSTDKPKEFFPEVTDPKKALKPKEVLDILKRGTVDPKKVVGDEGTAFESWLDMLKKKGIAKEADVIKELKNIETSGRSLDTVRHKLKEKYKDAILDEMVDPAILKKKYPSLPWKKNPADALAEARHRELLDLTKDLGPSDKGNIAERWYKAVYASGDEAHIVVTPEELKRLFGGKDLSRRVIDLYDKASELVRELKTIAGKMGDHDLEQFVDFLKFATSGKTVKLMSNGLPYKIGGVRYVFTVPSGVKANAAWMKLMLETNKGAKLTFEIFNVKGERKIIAARAKTNPPIESVKFLGSKEFYKWLGI
jgi:hypothetical protein